MKGDRRSWAVLNDEGKRLYDGVFQNGIVPIISIFSEYAVTDKICSQRFYQVKISELKPEQFKQLCEVIGKRQGANPENVMFELKNLGFVPLRESLTSEARTDEMRMLV